MTTPSRTEADRRRLVRSALIAGAALVVAVVAMFAAYSAGFGSPKPHNIPVAVAAPARDVAGLDASPALDARRAASPASARAQLRDRTVDGALELHSDATTLYVASGAGHSVAATLEKVGAQVAARSHTRLTTRDLARLDAQNPNGTIEFYAIVFLAVGGALGASILARVHGPLGSRRHFFERLTILLAYSAAAAGAFTLIADPVLGALTGHAGWLFLALWGFTAAVASAATGVAALFGPASGIVLTFLFTVLGNTSAGGAVSRPLLPPFFSALTPILPHAGGLDIVRSVQYFGGRGIGSGVLCLLIWGVGGLALMRIAALRRGRATPAASPVTVARTHQPAGA